MTNNITFIIAAQIDSPDRLNNLDLTIKQIVKNFPASEIILIESDEVEQLKGRYSGVKYFFVYTHKEVFFNKMNLYNRGARMSSTSVLCFVDVDVPPSKRAVLEAYELIVNNVYDIVYPYGISKGYNVPKKLHASIITGEDIYDYNEKKHNWLSEVIHIPYVECGGLFLINSSVYCHAGGGNEEFIGWGCEDDELLARLNKLGYRIGRVNEAILLHLEHTRCTGKAWYNAFLSDGAVYEVANRKRLNKTKQMSREEVLTMVKTWNNFGSIFQETPTVIISASYLDSHPEITFIQEVIESLDFTGLPKDTPIILSHDRIRPDTEGFNEKDEAYNKYFKNLEKYTITSRYTNIKIVVAPEWGHLTRTLEYAMGFVETKYVFVLQHDIHIRREIPVLKMMCLMEKYSHIKHLRFNVRMNLPTFIWWDGYTGGTRLFAEEEYDGFKLCVTPAWSDQNHLATKQYYEELVFPACTNPDGELIYDFMENRMNGLSHHDSKYGTYIYGGLGDPRTSRHSDGRKSSPEPDED